MFHPLMPLKSFLVIKLSKKKGLPLVLTCGLLKGKKANFCSFRKIGFFSKLSQ